GITFPNIRDASMKWIWYDSPAFNKYRGDDWMKQPCRSCPNKARDFGGCRCQAFMLTGDAANTDPVCDLSPHHHVVLEAVDKAQQQSQPATAPAKPIIPIMYRDDKNSRKLSEGVAVAESESAV
ncbi:MAG: hypothetical protein M3Q32_10830, partial [Pseudomonadota bacterium]|nr:hypothetical protein [Pseudomonadota bacterium]